MNGSFTPTRRAVLAGAGAAAVVPAAAASPGADDALIRLCAAFLQRERIGRALSAQADAMPKGPARDAVEARHDEATAGYHPRLDAIIDTPAVTLAGVRAKAEVALGWVQLDRDGWPLPDDALPWSLARDVLALTQA